MKIREKNQLIVELIKKLRETSYGGNSLWKKVAEDLNKPSRKQRIVNLSKINRYSKENDTVVVPGKVLASGELNHRVIIAAYKFSEESIRKIERAGASAITIEQLMKKNPKGKNISIIG